MKAKICLSLGLLLSISIINGLNIPYINPATVHASQQVYVTDVCTKSFSVIYSLSEHGQGMFNLRVYDSMGSLIQQAGVTIENDPAPAHAAPHESMLNEVIRFTVKGLEENTSYFYQLTSDGVASIPPDNPTYYGEDYMVTTEKLNGAGYLNEGNIVTNDTLILPSFHAGDNSLIGSSVILVNILDSQNNRMNDYSLSAWAGSCILPEENYACINLNNLFNQNKLPLELNGGEKAEIIYVNEAQNQVNREVKFMADIPQESKITTSYGPKVIPQPRIANFYYRDEDHDGFGSMDYSLFFRLTPPSGYSKEDKDCNDLNAQIYPGADELSDGLDNDCDGEVDEGLCNGDLNGDKLITPADALAAFKCYLGSGACSPCADVNKDGLVTPSDALCLFRKYLGTTNCLD
ncbi:MAG: MopE-related protein [bacterium]